MLDFSKVLDVFKDYLQCDPFYEVVSTSHGYTLMAWEPARKQWYNAEVMDTPEMLAAALLRAYAEYLEDQITGSERDMTKEERAQVDAKCEALKKSCFT